MLGESAITLTFVGVWLRLGVLAVLAAAVPIAALAWAVRTRRLSPFSAAGRAVRRLTDPLLDPLVRRFGRFGVRADTAPWWGILFLLLAGATLIVLLDVVGQMLGDLYLASQGVGDGFLRLIITWSFELLRLALLVRVIGSWFGWERHPIGRLAWRMTEWLLGPIRRNMPAFGAVDLSPMIAWFALAIAEQVLRSAF